MELNHSHKLAKMIDSIEKRAIGSQDSKVDLRVATETEFV